MAMATITVEVDASLKEDAERLFSELGLTMASALSVFLSMAVRKNKIPFELEGDPFYSKRNMDELKERIAQFNLGEQHVVRKSFDELEEMANG